MDAATLLANHNSPPSSLGPPTDVPANELLLRLKDSIPPSELLAFPRLDDDGKPLFEYRMRILSQFDLDSARASAVAYTKRKLKEDKNLTDSEIASVRKEAWEEIYEDAKCVELLFKACRKPDDVTRGLFTTPEEIRRLLTTDEISALFNAYLNVQARFGPMFRVLTDEEIEQWIERLTAGVGSYPFLGLGHAAHVQLTISLAYRCRQLKTDIGLSGLPVSDSPKETLEMSETPPPQSTT